jgi:hypothetical protein
LDPSGLAMRMVRCTSIPKKVVWVWLGLGPIVLVLSGLNFRPTFSRGLTQCN